MANTPHQPWADGARSAGPEPFDWQALIPYEIFTWKRDRWMAGGSVTTVRCGGCTEEYQYGGNPKMRPYQWARDHRCHSELSLLLADECVRLFR